MILLDNQDLLVERRQVPAKHALSLLPEIYVERGTKEDWDLLHELHYKAENLGIGPRIFRCVLRGQTIGVGVMTVPKMLLSGRNELFTHLRPNVGGRDTKIINKYRAEWINDHACTNSRLVLDTMYRGAGIAYRMQNLMMRMTGCKLVEFQSSMSKFNPFASKAGIRFTKPKRSSNYERGLQWFRRWFESIPTDFVGIMAELDLMPGKAREKCVAEMRKFYYDFSSMEKSGDNRMNGTRRVDALPVDKLLKNLQQLVFASPLYGVYVNPDYDDAKDCAVELPDRLPLLAFDNQAVDAPLNLSTLH
jgi:ABC-type ATPase with predicted acetyltransferase domain